MVPSVGASAFTGRYPPNSNQPDVIPACGNQIPEGAPNGIYCKENTDSGGNIWASARSRHTGGVNAALCDGSVRFFDNSISQKTWQALCTRSGGEVLGDY
jgi:prepilin-type processing-associated H-X9-DG protein